MPSGSPAWSRGSRRLAYALDDRIHVLDVARGSDTIVGPRLEGDVGWSRDGRSLFVLTKDTLYRLRGGRIARVAAGAQAMSISPDARWIATVTFGGWSAPTSSHVTIVRATDGGFIRQFPGVAAAWSPSSNRLAIESRTGIQVFDMRTRRLRTLTTDLGFGDAPTYGSEHGFGVAWAPDGRSVAYIAGAEKMTSGRGWGIVSGDLNTVTLNGKTQTIVPADHAYGGRMTALAWTAVPRAARYPAPETVPRDRVTTNSVLADGGIEFLAADGPASRSKHATRFRFGRRQPATSNPCGRRRVGAFSSTPLATTSITTSPSPATASPTR